MFKKLTGIKNIFVIIVFIYLAYLAKTALGINISDNYSVPNVFKLPIRAINYTLAQQDFHCGDRLKKLHTPICRHL